jgi:hypothetical protein
MTFRDDCDRERVHGVTGGATPEEAGRGRTRRPAGLGSYRWQHHRQGLYQLPAAA